VSEIDIEGREILHDVFTKDGTEYRRVPRQILNSHETKAAIARGNLYCNRRTKFGKKLVRLIETAEKYEAERAAAIERSGLGDAMARHWESAYEIEKLAHEASEIELQTMVGCSFKLARSPPTLRSRFEVGHYRGRAGQLVGRARAIPHAAVWPHGDDRMKPQPAGDADWRRRHALNMAGQLPENVNDALAILDLLRELVLTFLHVDVPEPAKAPVVTLVRPRPDLSA